jgi:hypothetical protein
MRKIVMLLTCLFLVSACGNTTEKTNTTTNTATQEKPIPPTSYEILKVEDQSRKAMGNKSLSAFSLSELEQLPVDKKMSYRVVLPADIKEIQVKPTVKKIISDITSNDNDIDEIGLLLYSNADLISGAWDIGMADWGLYGDLGNVTAEIAQSNDRKDYDISFTIRENLDQYLTQKAKSEDKFGFTEEQRKQIYKDYVAADDRAWAESDRMYPQKEGENGTKWSGKHAELMKKYRAGVRTKYNLTEEQMKEIVKEGFDESWPMD